MKQYILTTIQHGGSRKFLHDLQHQLSLTFHFLNSVEEFKKTLFHPNDVLIFQQFMEKDIDKLILQLFSQPNHPRLFLFVHDYFFLSSSSLLIPNHTTICPLKKRILQIAEKVVFPSHYILGYYRQFVDSPRFIYCPHIDNINPQPLRVPLIQKKIIYIGIITPINVYKGKNLLIRLFRSIKEHLGYSVEYHLFGPSPFPIGNHVKHISSYTEDDIYPKIQHLHGMLFLNQYPEIYSYALTKGINSGLPLLYSNIGAIKERLEELQDERYFPVLSPFTLLNDMERFLKFIVQYQGTGGDIGHSFPYRIPELYKNMFSSTAAIHK